MEYGWAHGHGNFSHDYLFPAVADEIRGRRRLLDMGCGNASLTAQLAELVIESATGLEASRDGVEQARRHYSHLDVRCADVDTPIVEDLCSCFDAVTAVEVIEHLYLPGNLFVRAREAMTSDGILVVTTPYHAYVKNLALALTNSFDRHWMPLKDHGHVKFFSPSTLSTLAERHNFHCVRLQRVGRWAPFAKSMVMTFKLSELSDEANRASREPRSAL